MSPVPATPRERAIKRCLFVSLGLCLPLYVLSALGSGVTLFLSDAGVVATIAFTTVVLILTYRMHAIVAIENYSIGLPPLAHLPTIACAFLIAMVWSAALIVDILFLVAQQSYTDDGEAKKAVLGIGIPFAFFIGAQIGLFVSVGILATKERGAIRRGEGIAMKDLPTNTI